MTGYGFTPETIQRIAGSLVHFFWQGAAIALTASLCLRLLRKRSAELRYSVSVGALAIMFAAPVLTYVFYAETGAAALRLFELTGKAVVDAAPAAWTQWILFGWLVGVLLFSARLMTGWRLSRRLVASATPLLSDSILYVFEDLKQRLELSRPIRLLLHARIDTPMVVGCLKPAVLLPVSALTGLSEDHLTAILAHELAHVRRHDFFVNLLQRCVESLLFYHPGVWWLSARIRNEREHCCDDIAVRMCGDRKTYIRALVELERKRQVLPALSVAANGGSLTGRVNRLLGLGTVGIDWQSAAATLLFALVLMIAAAWHSPATLQAAPALPPGLPTAAVIVPVTASPEPVAQAVNAIAAIITAQPQQPLEPQSAVIEGRVVRLGTSEPLSGVRVALIFPSADLNVPRTPELQSEMFFLAQLALSRTPRTAKAIADRIAASEKTLGLPPGTLSMPQTPTVVTDAAGRFSFKNLVPGLYTLIAERDGYFGIHAGSGRWASLLSMGLTIEEGKAVPQVEFRMSPGGVVSGRVRDLEGNPVAGIVVSPSRLTYGNLNGRELLSSWDWVLPQDVSTESSRTDGRGEYRMFWLPPGQYYIEAKPFGNVAARTFAPSNADPSSATLVTVKGGDEIKGIDITFRRDEIRLFNISGIALNPLPFPPPAPANIRYPTRVAGDRSVSSFILVPQEPGLLDSENPSQFQNSLPVSQRTNGEFEIRNVRPGRYDLYATYTGELKPGTTRNFMSRTSVDVRNEDVTDVRLTIGPGVDLDGEVVINGNGGEPVELNKIQVILNTFEDMLRRLTSPIASFSVDDAGRFYADNVSEGTYRFYVGGLPGGAYVEDVRQGGKSVFDTGLVLSSPPIPIQIVVNPKGNVVAGIVENSDHKPAQRVMVVLVPPEPQRRNGSRYRTVLSDESGKFKIQNVPPGIFTAYVLEDGPSTSWMNEKFLLKYQDKGKIVNVVPNGETQIQLQVIPSMQP